jgi:hypothetical protein
MHRRTPTMTDDNTVSFWPLGVEAQKKLYSFGVVPKLC